MESSFWLVQTKNLQEGSPTFLKGIFVCSYKFLLSYNSSSPFANPHWYVSYSVWFQAYQVISGKLDKTNLQNFLIGDLASHLHNQFT